MRKNYLETPGLSQKLYWWQLKFKLNLRLLKYKYWKAPENTALYNITGFILALIMKAGC